MANEPSGQGNFAIMFENGLGVKQDFKEALKWYGKAAEQGKVEAQFKMGVMYLHGRGTKQNCEKAKIWFRNAAEQDITLPS